MQKEASVAGAGWDLRSMASEEVGEKQGPRDVGMYQ